MITAAVICVVSCVGAYLLGFSAIAGNKRRRK